MTELTAEAKAEFWWQQADFDEFLNTRVEIGKAYRAAAKKLGLDIMQVSSVGNHGDEGYRAMIQINSKLCGESRRGLGLGRKRQRAKNRDNYIHAVVQEQAHQETACLQAQRPFFLDTETLAAVAHRLSEKDTLYAYHLAVTYYEQDREVEANEARERELRAAERVAEREAEIEAEREDLEDDFEYPMVMTMTVPPSADVSPYSADTRLGERTGSFCLNDEVEDNETLQQGFPRKVSPTMISKGFGISRDRLHAVGLSANGHSISRFQRLRKCGRPTPSMGHHHAADESSGAESGESQGEGEEEEEDPASSAFLQEYRNWRMGAPVRAGLPGHSEVKTYGTRKEYRAWRMWQKPLHSAANNDHKRVGSDVARPSIF